MVALPCILFELAPLTDIIKTIFEIGRIYISDLNTSNQPYVFPELISIHYFKFCCQTSPKPLVLAITFISIILQLQNVPL